jgi:beta-N-acetylhexosaminidase
MIDALAVLMPGFVGTTVPDWLRERLEQGLGGVCIFGENIESFEQLRALTDVIRAANPDALIAIDEEGGDVTRLYFDVGSPYPGNALLGRIDDPGFTFEVAATVGAQLRRVGVNLDFAPDVDINSNPDNPVIGVRSFGTDPQRVAEHSDAWVRGLQSAGVAASAKHFPGHGDTALDSHLSLPVVDVPLDVLRERELVPFRAAIAAGTRTIMSSHILLPQLDAENPATFSHRILGTLLREELGFDGVIVSDALDMVGASGAIGIPAAAARAIEAGCDLLCIGTKNTDEQLEAIVAALAAVDPGRLADAASRNRALARSLPPLEPADGFGTSAPRFDLEESIAAFDVRAGLVVAADRTLVAVETAANIAIGSAPWGPPVAARVREGDPLPEVTGQLVLVGTNNHRHGWVRELVEGARRAHLSVLVIDMGWPGDDRAYADVATFGASQHASSALLAWLERTETS